MRTPLPSLLAIVLAAALAGCGPEVYQLEPDANAVADATGERLRELPLSSRRVKAALGI